MREAAFETYPLPRIRSMGPMLFDPVWAREEHRSSGTEVLHVLDGELELEAPGGPYRAEERDTLMIPAATPHRDVFDPDAGVEIFFCSLEWPEETLKRYFSLVNNRALLALDARTKGELHAAFSGMAADLKGGSDADNLVCRARLHLVLMLALRGVETRGRDPGDVSYGRTRRRDLLEGARRYVLEHFHEPITLDRVAEALQVSGYYLSHVFSQESDLTLFSFVTSVRMERARELLAAGALNVSEVAVAVGYRDANYFSKTFRRHCGCSPREFQARALQTRR